VSVIVPTKNSVNTLEDCLRSIKAQTYNNIELIVVDNFSSDSTLKIAGKFTEKHYLRGPERSAQRNYAVKKSNGEYVFVIDSDMVLSDSVVTDCVESILSDKKARGVIIPEESFGEGFWAQCKKLERSFYVGVDWIEAARFFYLEDYQAEGGYNEEMVSGEDWDFSRRIGKLGIGLTV